MDTESLLYLAEQVVLPQLRAQQPVAPTIVAQRLQDLIIAQRSRARTMLTKVLPTFASPATTTGDAAAVAMPTVSDLKAAGLTVARLQELDADLTGEVLIRCGVVSSFKHLQELGIHSMDDFVHLVGPPHRVKEWVGGGEGKWKRDFAKPMNFTYDGWAAGAHQWLGPVDLAVMGLRLGTLLDMDPQSWSTLPDPRLWLSQGTQAEWVNEGILSTTQYARLLAQWQGKVPPPLPTSIQPMAQQAHHRRPPRPMAVEITTPKTSTATAAADMIHVRNNNFFFAEDVLGDAEKPQQ